MTTRLNWDDTPVFLAVARAGTLTAAAEQLSAGVATVSRRIERLEASLGVPLFIRQQTGYLLTDEGNALLPRAIALEDAMGDFRAGVIAEGQVVGHVRLATAENLANPIIIPALTQLLNRHPGLLVEVITDVAALNLHRREADLAVRMVRPKNGNVTVRRIGTLGFGLYGATSYIAERSGDFDGTCLDDDRFIGWSERQSSLPAAQWIEQALCGRHPALVTTTLSAQVSAAVSGLGLAVLPHFIAREAGLQQLALTLGLDQSIWLAVHSDLATSQRIRVVADYLINTISENSGRLKGES